jgi:hypothetical protein
MRHAPVGFATAKRPDSSALRILAPPLGGARAAPPGSALSRRSLAEDLKDGNGQEQDAEQNGGSTMHTAKPCKHHL